MKLSAKQKKLLLIIHILFASIWIGAVITLLVLSIKTTYATHDVELRTLHKTLLLIEYTMIIPPAFGSLLTGFLLSWWTNWGFFKYRWVTTKWIATVSLILFGALFLNTWLEGMSALAQTGGLSTVKQGVYKRYTGYNLIFVPLQWLVLIFMLVISVLKPWGKRKEKKAS